MAKTSIPEIPGGFSKGSFFRKKVWEYLFGGQFPIKGAGGTKVEWKEGNYFITSAAVRNSSGTTLEVINYSATSACESGKFYKIRTTDSAVVDGVNIGTEAVPQIITAYPGKYLCLKDVPANPTSSDMVPHLPSTIYFEFFTPAVVCTQDGAIEV